MRRLATLALLALVHLLATVLSIGLSIWLALRGLSSSAPAVLAPLGWAANAIAWVLAFPMLTAAYLARVNLLDTASFYGLATLNSVVWVAAAVLLRRACARRRPRAGTLAGGAA